MYRKNQSHRVKVLLKANARLRSVLGMMTDHARSPESRTTPEQVSDLFALLRLKERTFVADWRATSSAAQTAVDDLFDVINWLREEQQFAQADRIRTIAGRLARSVPPYPVFGGGWRGEELVRNRARTWPEQLSIKESEAILLENKNLSEENLAMRDEIDSLRAKLKRSERLRRVQASVVSAE